MNLLSTILPNSCTFQTSRLQRALAGALAHIHSMRPHHYICLVWRTCIPSLSRVKPKLETFQRIP